MWVLWTSKGGAGCSVTAAALGLLSAEETPTLLVDLGRDLPAIIGCEQAKSIDGGGLGVAAGDGQRLGVLDWLQAEQPPPDALGRLELAVTPNLSILPTGHRLIGDVDLVGGRDNEPWPSPSVELLAHILASEDRRVIVDVGLRTRRFAPLLQRAITSIMVVRPCYLALRHPMPPRLPDRVVLIREPFRALRRSDVAAAIGCDVTDSISCDPSVARAVDAGLLGSRLPRPLLRLRHLVADLSVEASRGQGPFMNASSGGGSR